MRRRLYLAWLLVALAAGSPALSAPSRGSKKGSSDSSGSGGGRREETGGGRRDDGKGAASDRGAKSGRAQDKVRGGDRAAASMDSVPASGRSAGPGRDAPGASLRSEPGALTRAAHEEPAAKPEAGGRPGEAAGQRTGRGAPAEPVATRGEAAGAHGQGRLADITPAERKIVERKLASAGEHGPTRSADEQIREQRSELMRSATQIAHPDARADRKELNGTLRGKYQDMVHAPSLAENKTQYKLMQKQIEAFEPDHIIAMDRGGRLVGEVLAAIDPQLGEKVVSIKGVDPRLDLEDKLPAKVAGYLAEMTALCKDGDKRIAVIDFEMGNHTSGALHAAAEKFLEDHPGTTISTFWIKETAQLRAQHVTDPTVQKLGATERLETHKFSVRWAVGEDVELISGTPGADVLKGLKSEPIHIFGDDGVVTHTVEPKPGQTSREIVVGLLSGQLSP